MKARKLKVRINRDNDWMYCVYRNRGQGSITLGVMALCRFSIYVCGLTSMKLIPHLISKVRKMCWQNGGQGPVTLGVMSLHRSSNFAILENFHRFLRTDF